MPRTGGVAANDPSEETASLPDGFNARATDVVW